jgi:hypothetical protein
MFRQLLSYYVHTISFATGLLLVSAATLKWVQSYEVPQSIFASNFQLFKILFLPPVEFVAGIWLLSGQFRRLAVGLTILLFGCFSVAAGMYWLRGAETCSCFGRIDVPVEATILMDVLLFVGLLIAWNTGVRNLQTNSDQKMRQFRKRVLVLFIVSSIFSIIAITRSFFWTYDIADVRRDQGHRTVHFNTVRLPELTVFLSNFEHETITDSLIKRTPSRLVFILYRNDCLHCKNLLESIEKLGDFKLAKVVFCDISDGQSTLVFERPLQEFRPDLESLRSVKWAIQAPASLFYSNGRPVSIQVGADRLEQLQWAEN